MIKITFGVINSFVRRYRKASSLLHGFDCIYSRRLKRVFETGRSDDRRRTVSRK